MKAARFAGILIVLLLASVITTAALAEGSPAAKYQVRIAGENHLTMFQGTTGKIAIYVSVTGNGADQPVELMIHGRKEQVSGNGVFTFLIAPGQGGEILGEVLGSDAVEASAPVSLGSIKLVPVPSQLITPPRDHDDIGMPDGLNTVVSTNLIPSGDEPGNVGHGYAFDMFLSSMSGIKSMYIVLEDTGKSIAALSSKAVNSPKIYSIKTIGEMLGGKTCMYFSEERGQARYLPAGISNLSLCIQYSNGSVFGPIALLPLKSTYLGDQAETIPHALTMSQGTRVRLVVPAGDDFMKWFDRRTSTNKKVAEVNSKGELIAKGLGTARLTLRTWDEWTYTCDVKVVPNSFKRTKPLVRSAQGVYTSTKQLYYSGSALKAEVYVYNRTPNQIKRCSGYVFRLYDGEKLLYEKPLGDMKLNSPLKTKRAKVYKLTITEKMLAGVKAKQFDLGTGRMHAVIASVNPSQPVQPLIKGMEGAVQVKAIEMAW